MVVVILFQLWWVIFKWMIVFYWLSLFLTHPARFRSQAFAITSRPEWPTSGEGLAPTTSSQTFRMRYSLLLHPGLQYPVLAKVRLRALPVPHQKQAAAVVALHVPFSQQWHQEVIVWGRWSIAKIDTNVSLSSTISILTGKCLNVEI